MFFKGCSFGGLGCLGFRSLGFRVLEFLGKFGT